MYAAVVCVQPVPLFPCKLLSVFLKTEAYSSSLGAWLKQDAVLLINASAKTPSMNVRLSFPGLIKLKAAAVSLALEGLKLHVF